MNAFAFKGAGRQAVMEPERAVAEAEGLPRAELYSGRLPERTLWHMRFRASVHRLETLIRRHRASISDEAGLEPLFCAFTLLLRIDFPLRQLLTALPAEPGPLRVSGLIGALGNLGFYPADARPDNHLMQTREPFLFLPSGGGAEVVFHCPETGTLERLHADGRIEEVKSARDLAKGKCWTFALKSESHPLSAVRRSHTGHSWFRALLAKFGRVGFGLVITSMAIAVTSVMLPLFTIQIYLHVISLGSLDPLPAFIVGMGLTVALEAVLLTKRTRILAWVANRIEYLVSISSFERILKIRPSLSERAAVTDQAARLRTFENIRDFITGTAATSLLEIPVSILATFVIAVLAGWLAVIPVLGICAHLALFFLLRREARIRTSIAADESTEMQRITIETLEKRDAIRQSGLQHLWSGRMIESARRQQAAQLSLRTLGSAAEALSMFVLTTCTVFVLCFGTLEVWSGIVGTGGLLAIVILTLRALSPYHVLCLSLQRFEQLRNSIDQLNTLMEVAPERDEEREYTQIRSIEGAVSFLNVGFRSRDTRPVFVGLDIEISQGDVVAITGANGTGKSTILKLVQGMSDLSIGTIRIDGIDMRQLPQEDLRRRISYVPQQPKLFPGSLRDNLLLADPLASEEKLRSALRTAGLLEDIEALPDGLDHPCSESASGDVPSEFLFKFAIAQAILVNGNLFLIDEIPNMLLDGEVGEVVRNLIRSYRNRGTVLFVSHRSDFLDLADRVVALRYGKVPVISTPERLLARAA
ncbi:peptidase domain-containing ABC transporter [Afifella sp. IM 167]|uniref:peptidase domain-containing ABC transporter n=1 Tax=Afifella sp. IM 167 TaxID=2033586 RepID=UPI001CCC5535|nr:ATP-binding cassette domain-containing protein [Afifella sp. IM 167]MBZ8135423.1 ABC transporter [Afifella sp. IM 167]